MTPKLSIYRHYKDNLYQVLHTACAAKQASGLSFIVPCVAIVGFGTPFAYVL